MSRHARRSTLTFAPPPYALRMRSFADVGFAASFLIAFAVGCSSGGDSGAAGAESAKLDVANVSYGGDDPLDVTFALTGGATVAKITNLDVAFAGAPGDERTQAIRRVTYDVDCASAPWTSPSSVVVQVKASSRRGLMYPCGAEEKRTAGLIPRPASPDAPLTITLKGISTDASPWSVTATASKR